MSQDVQNHILKRYNLIKKVGSGAYGHVWKVNDRKTGQIFALKKIFDAFQHSTDAQRTYREIVLLHQLDHQNIVKLYDVIRADNDKDLYLVFEYMEADLHNAISQKILKDIHNRFIIYQLVKGMKFLHSAQVVHRDLKPSNILLNSDCLLKICDFGLARSLVNDEASDIIMTEQVATRWYRSPEVLLGSHNYDKSADIWSIGCILAEMLIEKPIFPGTSTLNQLERILSFTGRPKKQDINSLNSQLAYSMIEQLNEIKQKSINEWFKPQIPKDAINLVYKLLQFNPTKRLSINEIISHPYLSKFHNPKQELESKKIIRPPVSDNQKLNLKQYRFLIYERIKQVYHHSYNQNKVQPDNNTKANNYLSSKQKTQQKQSEQRYSYSREKSLSRQLNKINPQKVSQSNLQNNNKQNKTNGTGPKNLSPNIQKSLGTKNQSSNYGMVNKIYQQKTNENLVNQNPIYESHQNSLQKHRPSSIVMRESNKYQPSNTNYNYSQIYKPSQPINNHIIKNQLTEQQNVKRKNSLKQMRRTKNSSPSLKQNYNMMGNKINSNFNQTFTDKSTTNPQYTRNYSATISPNYFTPINKQIKHHTNNYSGYQPSKFMNNYNIIQQPPIRY